MATKTVEISPAGAGTASCVDIAHETPTGAVYDFYQLQATANAGWQFDHFEWTQRADSTAGGGTVTDTDYSSAENPHPVNAATHDMDLMEGHLDAPVENFTVWTIFNLKAVFTAVAPGHTHKLVNSFNRNGSSPVRLVYDDRAGHAAQLVADY